MSTLGVALMVACAVMAVTEDASATRPKLLANKEVVNNAVFQNKQLTVKYTIYNVGLGSAFQVELVDNGFIMSDFSKVSGMTKVKYDRIAPNSNVTHSVVVTPLKTGVYNFTAAQITYSSQQQMGKNPQIGYTTAPGEVRVYPIAEYDRYFTSHATDWLCFAGMIVPSILLPGAVWWMSYRRYCSSSSVANAAADKIKRN
jgi:translocon-associated protein subunit beta